MGSQDQGAIIYDNHFVVQPYILNTSDI